MKRLEKVDTGRQYYHFDLNTLIPFEILNYYRYMGSLTTPNCQEGINWFLAASPILKISQKQIEMLQNLSTHHDTKVR